jgi:hypothetical protein
MFDRSCRRRGVWLRQRVHRHVNVGFFFGALLRVPATAGPAERTRAEAAAAPWVAGHRPSPGPYHHRVLAHRELLVVDVPARCACRDRRVLGIGRQPPLAYRADVVGADPSLSASVEWNATAHADALVTALVSRIAWLEGGESFAIA